MPVGDMQSWTDPTEDELPDPRSNGEFCVLSWNEGGWALKIH